MFKRIPIILILSTNKNVALIYSVTNCQQKTKDCALSRCFEQTAALLFLSLMFAALHNQSPLITMVTLTMRSLRTRNSEKHEQESRSLKQESLPFTPRSLPILPLVLLIRTLKPAENCGGG